MFQVYVDYPFIECFMILWWRKMVIKFVNYTWMSISLVQRWTWQDHHPQTWQSSPFFGTKFNFYIPTFLICDLIFVSNVYYFLVMNVVTHLGGGHESKPLLSWWFGIMTCKDMRTCLPFAFISFPNNLKMHVLIEFTMTWGWPMSLKLHYNQLWLELVIIAW